MINIRTLRKLNNDDGLTLKHGKIITYKSGWQVADYGVECKTAEEAMIAIKAYGGNCGIWYSEGIFYIDHSYRVNTKKQAITDGIKYNQISVYGWKSQKLAYCK